MFEFGLIALSEVRHGTMAATGDSLYCQPETGNQSLLQFSYPTRTCVCVIYQQEGACNRCCYVTTWSRSAVTMHTRCDWSFAVDVIRHWNWSGEVCV